MVIKTINGQKADIVIFMSNINFIDMPIIRGLQVFFIKKPAWQPCYSSALWGGPEGVFVGAIRPVEGRKLAKRPKFVNFVLFQGFFPVLLISGVEIFTGRKIMVPWGGPRRKIRGFWPFLAIFGHFWAFWPILTKSLIIAQGCYKKPKTMKMGGSVGIAYYLGALFIDY